ncbi:MAG: hypothetical protein GEU99_07020 [Luteitalea sp.]|nr:hypothetical protein [Luteitalea sp.]
MGKRELVLIAGFVFLGIVVYWFTAAPANDDDGGLSLRRIARNIRAEVSGTRASRPVTASARTSWSPGMTAVELEDFRGTLVVKGQTHGELGAELSGEAFGLDETEATAAAKDIRVALEPHEDAIRLVLHVPPQMLGGRRPDLTLTVDMPAGMHLRLSDVEGNLDVRQIASVTFDDVSAQIHIVDVAGQVSGKIERNSVDISRVGVVDLVTSRGELIVSDVNGSVDVRQDRGSISLSRVKGPVTIDADRTDIEIDGTLAPLVVEARRGKLTVHRAEAPVTIDAENLGVRVTLARAVPLNVTTSDGRLDITLPPHDGVLVDATVSDGELLVPDALRVDVSDDTQHARGPIGGGGAPLVVTNRNGTIIIRQIPQG